jgi:hypothetical protein|tara:strand:- start:520 stop:981 length:462 start_codon:yes stop_codon:yes gene_type:complete
MMRLIFPIALVAFSPAFAQVTPPADDHTDGHTDGAASENLTLETAPFRQEIAIACDFKTECVEDEPCTETEFTPQITGIAGGLTPDDLVVQSTMVTDAETVELLGVKSGMALSLSGGTFAARHLLSITETGAARYTVHYADGPFVISYLGTCN